MMADRDSVCGSWQTQLKAGEWLKLIFFSSFCFVSYYLVLFLFLKMAAEG